MTDNELRKDVLYIRNNIPTLYKYLDYEGSIAMLVKSQLLFRNPSSFNDPYDCYAGLIDFRETKYYRQYLTPIISKYPEGLNELFLETLGKETDDETSMI